MVLKSFFNLIFFTVLSHSALSQFQFISPQPGSAKLPVAHNIIIREGDLIDPLSIDTSLFTIKGSKSGLHTIELVLCDDGKTINLNPNVVFTHDETVTVTIANAAFSMLNGAVIPSYTFKFTTIADLTAQQEFNISNADSLIRVDELNQWPVMEDVESESRKIEGLFSIDINTNPSEGRIFFDCRPATALLGAFFSLDVIENAGDSVFQRSYNSYPYDFQLGKNGYFNTYIGGLEHFEILDSNFNVLDTYVITNGFSGDPHELTMLSNGYVFITGLEDQPVDDSSDQVIRGSVIQEFDPNHNIVFEWRSLDHIDISEAPHLYLQTNILDYVHTNSIEVDTDGNILTSHRHLDQVNKIDVRTGEFIWRLGGVKNEFTFINDSLKFFYQHDCRRIANGNITLYDDGNYHVPARSFAKEYQLDEANKTATLVWDYSHPDVDGSIAFYSAMGNVQRLSNGNTLIGWGYRTKSTLPSITEIDPMGNIVWEMTLSGSKNYISYRAHKYQWQPCARPTFDSMRAQLINEYSVRLEWSAVANPSQQYEIQYRKQDDSAWLARKVSSSNNYLEISDLDSLTLYEWRIQSWCDTIAGIASHFTAIKTFTTPGKNILPPEYFFTMYPNPVNEMIFISCGCSISAIQVFNVFGQLTQTVSLTGEQNPSLIQFSVSNFPRGNYFVKVTNEISSEIRKMTIVR